MTYIKDSQGKDRSTISYSKFFALPYERNATVPSSFSGVHHLDTYLNFIYIN